MAGVSPDSIELVEAHGTGTRVGDTAEITALAEVYSSAQQSADAPRSPTPKPWCAIGSVKSQIGHTKAAAGAASLIKATLALHNKILPPTLKVSQPIEPLRLPDSPFYVNTKMRPWLPRAEHPRRAALSAFGFGGSNFHAVLEEYRSEKSTPDWDGTVEIAALSAETPRAVAAALDSVPVNDWDAFARFAESSRASFRSDAPCRLAFAAHRGRTDLAKLIAGAKAKLQADPAAASWHTPDGAHYGSGSTAAKVAVLFPGQGSQYVGMLRDLACLFPELLDSLTEANAVVAAQMHDNTDARRLSDRIYPPTSFDPEQQKANDRDLRDTRNAQPAIGAVSFGAWTVLHERFGMPADAFAGHSYGELTALAAAGRFKPAELFALSRLRGDLMARKPEGDPGAMLAVRASVADIEPVLKSNGLNLVVANLNAPNQTVLSGSTSEVEKAEKALVAAGLAGVRLPVAAAFHSEFVADAAVPFRAALDGVPFAPGSAPVFANTTASPYPADEKSAKDLLANQLAKPVAFIDQIRAIADSGVRTFVEVGPGAVLTRLAEAILDASGVADAEAFGIDAPGGKRPGVLDLGSALARLAARGVPVRLDAWEAGSRCRPPQPASNTGLTVPICGANYVTPRSKRPPRTVPPSAQANGVTRGARPVDPARTAKVQTMPDAPNSGEPRDSGALAQALAVTQQTLAAIQRMQEQTAQLHRQFLESQESAQRTLHALVEQQQTLLTSGVSGKAVALPPLPPLPPVPAPVARPVPAAPPVATPAVVPPRPAPVATPVRASHVERVAPTLLEVVAEKTGYPVASLDLKLSLDSDLGVDSIKRVEILSALQERLPEAPQVKPEHLGTLHTLQDVADFLSGRAGLPEAPATARISVVPAIIAEPDLPEPMAPLTELAPPDTEPVAHIHQARMTDSVLTALRESGTSPHDTRTPPPIRARSRSAEAARSGKPVLTDGVDRSILQPVDLDPAVPRPRLPLPPGGDVVVVGEPDVLTGQVIAQLTQKGLQVRQSVWSDVDRFEAGATTTGLILLAPARPDPEVNRLAFQWLQRIGPKLRQAARHGATLFATVARIDGAFGLNHLSAEADPTAGGLAGLVKTARLEWPEVSCKAIDLDPAFTDTGAAAAAIADEVSAAGSVEVGIAATHRCALELARTVRRPDGAPFGLGPNDVVLITGGARGVTAEAAVALAEAYHPTLILTGRTTPPEPEPEWLAPLMSEAEIKAAIASRLAPGSGPRQIGEQYHKLVAQREVRRTLQRIEENGSRVAYFPVDVADAGAVAGLLGEVRAKFGPITGLIHGAGVLADRRIEDLTTDDFDRVYATKVHGLRNLLQSIGGDELKVLVLFSSITARQGRIGQLAYAVANEVLNKTAQVESRRRPGCRVVALNWGPWDGGMVTPALRKQFESEGVGLISLADGAAFMVEELNAAGKAVEVLALGKRPGTGSGSLSGGQRSGTVAVPAAARRSGSAPIVSPPGPVQNHDMTVAYERAIDLESHPVLRSHVIDSRCVLPMALHVELLAHAALHGHPGLMFHGFNDLRITQGVKLDAAESVPLRAFAGKAVRQDHHFIVPVELRGKRKDGRDVVKSRAEIVLAPALPDPPTADGPPQVSPYPLHVERAYRELLFHGPDLHGIERLLGIGEMAVMGTARPAPPPAQWIRSPMRSAWVADPLVLDASFQMMILWSREQHGAASLPSFVGRYRQFRRRFEGPVAIVVRVTRDNGTFARADIDYLDADGRVIAQMQDYECMIEKSLNQAFGRNQLGAVKA
jgi:malonyl CoA-acyl carrier protein transacylase